MAHIDRNSIRHFGICFALSLLGLYAVAFAMGAAVCREWKDKQAYGHWCWWDIVFDVLGCGAGYLVHRLIF